MYGSGLFISMVILGLSYSVIYHQIVMPLFSGDFIHCITMGGLYGLISYLIALIFFKRYIRLEKTNIELKIDTLTDKLTGLLNRRALEDELVTFRQDKIYSSIFIDIDNFRDFNNKFGHEVGDRILMKVGNTIRNEVRQEDRVYRYGGEEIVVLLRNCNKVDALRIAEKIRLKVNMIKYEQYPKITLSIGVSSYPEDGKEIKSVIEGSDMAMLRAKQQGKNRTVTC